MGKNNKRSKIKSSWLVKQRKWVLGAVLLLGLLLRIWNLADTQPFLMDEARDATVIRALASGDYYPLVGPSSSVGRFRLGPAYYYLMAPWMALLGDSPMVLGYAMAVFGIVSIGLMYWVLRNWWPSEWAIVGSLGFGIHYYLVAGARHAWHPYLLPLVGILLLWLGYRFVVKEDWGSLLWWLFVWGVGIQLHYSGLGMIGMLVVMVFRKRNQWGEWQNWAAKGVGVWLALWIPVAVYYWQGGSTSTVVSQVSGLDWQGLGGVLARLGSAVVQISVTGLGLPQGWYWGLVGWLVLGSWVYFGWYQRQWKDIDLLIGGSLLGMLVFLSLAPLDQIYSHYVGVLIPLVLVIGVTVVHWFRNKRWVWGLVVVWGLINLWQVSQLQEVDWKVDDYRQVGEMLAAEAGNGKFNLYLYSASGDTLGLNYRYFVEPQNRSLAPVWDFKDLETMYLLSEWEVTSLEEVQIELPEGRQEVNLPSKLLGVADYEDRLWIYKVGR